MNILEQYINSIVQEGVMDNLTTQIARSIVNYLKKKGNANPIGNYIPSQAIDIGDVHVMIAFLPVGSEHPLKAINAKYIPVADDYHGVEIRVIVPQPFDEKQLGQFLPGLKNTIRHELEHVQQAKREPKTGKTNGVHYHGFNSIPGHYPDLTSGFKQSPSDLEFDYDKMKKYFLHPMEVEAYVMGAYKEAKTTKTPLHDIFIKRLTALFYHFTNNGLMQKKWAVELIKNIREAWEEYAQQRLGYIIPTEPQQ
jgi:hypothetical protein